MAEKPRSRRRRKGMLSSRFNLLGRRGGSDTRAGGGPFTSFIEGIANAMAYVAQLLQTGQTTSYGSGTGVDDGALHRGYAKSYTVLDAVQYSGTTNVVVNSKTEAKSNNCVQDNETGLMWTRGPSASVGPLSDGKLPWTTTGSGGTAEGIFAYVAAANAASLAGHNDWRIPNLYELLSISDFEAPTAAPDAAAFASANVTQWVSTTVPSTTANAYQLSLATSAVMSSVVKTGTAQVMLVRDG